MSDDDPLAFSALMLGGGLAGYAAGRALLAPPRASTLPIVAAPGVVTAAATSATVAIEATAPAASAEATAPPEHDEAGVARVPAPTEPASRRTTLPRTFDPIFARYRGSIPIEYLRALAWRESRMDPGNRKGPAWGLLQIIESVRAHYNRVHRTSYTRDDLLDPTVNVAIASWLLRFIIRRFERNHPDVPNLRPDWQNPRFVELITASWNAGYSDTGGVGKVVRYLKERDLPVTLDTVHAFAADAGAVRFLRDPVRVRWAKSVVDLYQRERATSVAAYRSAKNEPERHEFRRIAPMKDWAEMHIAIKKHFAELRGFDLAANGRTRIPRTTNSDVRQLAALWDRAAAGARLDVMHVPYGVESWRPVSAEAKRLTEDADPTALYPHNEEFWRMSQRLAIRVQLGAEQPPPFDFWDSLAENVRRAPERIATAVTTVGRAIGGGVEHVGQGAAKAATGAARVVGGALSEVGKPVLIGGALVGAGIVAVSFLRQRAGERRR